ncbi:hypothetical protein ACQEVC_34495 [Plantactinospora sp. CA-294935]|uniref:hypothetical protein n=1 Tax=Plantactinospora sp. CA-294935 TaxID=3240012 RepID=UPI003D8AFDAB
MTALPNSVPGDLPRPNPSTAAPSIHGDAIFLSGDVPIAVWRLDDRDDGSTADPCARLASRLARRLILVYSPRGDAVVDLVSDPHLEHATAGTYRSYLAIADPSTIADFDTTTEPVSLVVLRWPPSHTSRTTNFEYLDELLPARAAGLTHVLQIVAVTALGDGDQFLYYASKPEPRRRGRAGPLPTTVRVTASTFCSSAAVAAMTDRDTPRAQFDAAGPEHRQPAGPSATAPDRGRPSVWHDRDDAPLGSVNPPLPRRTSTGTEIAVRAGEPGRLRPMLGLPIPELPGAADGTGTRCVVTPVDRDGRLADRSTVKFMGWAVGYAVELVIEPGPIGPIVVARTGREVRIDPRGHLRLPLAVRRECRIAAKDRVLLAANPRRNELLVVPMATLDDMVVRYRQPDDGGASR